MLYEIRVGTITRAQRSIYILKSCGMKAGIGRLKHPQKGDGCGYTVRVRTEDIHSVLSLLKDNGIEYYGADAV